MDQLFVNTGLLFSTNAVIPSFLSSCNNALIFSIDGLQEMYLCITPFYLIASTINLINKLTNTEYLFFRILQNTHHDLKYFVTKLLF